MPTSTSTHELNTRQALEFIQKLYSGLQTIRLYPPTNPQVARSNEFIIDALKRLLHEDTKEVIVSRTEGLIAVNGTPLPERDQKKPQIQGFFQVFTKLDIHSFTFQPTFSLAECSRFLTLISELLADKPADPIKTVFANADISTVKVDQKRYVAIGEDEQVVNEADLAASLGLSDDDLVNHILAKGLPGSALTGTGDGTNSGSTQPFSSNIHANLSGLNPEALARLLTLLPETSATDDMVNSTIKQLNSGQVDELVSSLISRLTPFSQANQEVDAAQLNIDPSVLKRLAKSPQGKNVSDRVYQHLDAILLQSGSTQTETGTIPKEVLERLQQVDWSTPLLITTAEQTLKDSSPTESQIKALGNMLGQFERYLDADKQQQLVEKAGKALATMAGDRLTQLLPATSDGALGERLFRQIITQLPEDRLDQALGQLNEDQVNRLIFQLVSEIPVTGSQADGTAAMDTPGLDRLAHTKHPNIEKTIARHTDAHLLRQNELKPTEMPASVRERLQQPDWSAPVLVTALQPFTDVDNTKTEQPDFTSFSKILDKFEYFFGKNTRTDVAVRAGRQLAELDEKDLGRLLVHRFQGIFGKELYEQIIAQLSDEKFEKLTLQMHDFARLREKTHLDIDDKDLQKAFKRLMQTVRGEKMRAVIDMHRKQLAREEQQKKERLQHGFRRLIQGDHEVLKDASIYKFLPESVVEFLAEGRDELADNLLVNTVTGLQNPDASIRNNAFTTLAEIAEQLANVGQWQRLTKLLPALEQGCCSNATSRASTVKVFKALATYTRHHLTNGNCSKANDILTTLRRIKAAAPVGASYFAIEADSAITDIPTLPILEKLLKAYLNSAEQGELAGQLLASLGRRSAEFQLDRLVKSENRFERQRLLTLIKNTGSPVTDILLEKLHSPSPWYVIRNVIRLLGELGDSTHIDTIAPFLKNEDLRVQQEVIQAAGRLNGDKLPRFLSTALTSVHDQLKSKVVQLMGRHPDAQYLRALLEQLESTVPYQGKNKGALQIEICKVLGKIASRRAAPALSRVIQSKALLGLGGFSGDVKEAAKAALQEIRRTTISEDSRDRLSLQAGLVHETLSLSSATDNATPAIDFADDYQERKIMQMAQEGNPEQAKKELFDLILTKVKKKDFAAAERLRDRIYEIDPMALTEIIRSGEIIEQEKNGAIDENDFTIWRGLVDQLSSEEYSQLYHELYEKEYQAEEIVIKQGAKNDSLFFINSGSVKISHMKGERELFITSLNRGELAGENFFTASYWTVSMTTLTPARIACLKQDSLKKLDEILPGFKRKLQDYYEQQNSIKNSRDKKKLDRRNYERFTLSRKIQVQLADPVGKPIGRGFRAELCDISRGGLAYLIRISNQHNTRLLLGRKMKVLLPIAAEDGDQLQLDGLIIGVQPFNLLARDYSIHFRFDKLLSAKNMQHILG
ncbi:MAG: hypothetical protein CSA34_03320 [Desulfobulbus propionicus]|nr:MAG: hypothetical protein CSA34_03320 [Desulfobulbus propionicus]